MNALGIAIYITTPHPVFDTARASFIFNFIFIIGFGFSLNIKT